MGGPRNRGEEADCHDSVGKTTVCSDALMKSEASMLASFSSSKTVCEVPKLDIFLPEDDVSPVKPEQRLQGRDAMQLQDGGHDSYRNQLGNVTAAVSGVAVATEDTEGPDLLALMDEADEV